MENLTKQLGKIRAKFEKEPNAKAEKEAVESLAEKFGGKLNVIAELKKTDNELKDYFKNIIGMPTIKKQTAEKFGKELLPNEDGQKFAEVNGKTYKIDTIKKTLKRVYNDFADLEMEALPVEEVPMTVYQRYLRDKFDEDAPIKNGKLYFRGYRISCNSESGFIIEDTQKHYEIVENTFEGIPTPKELGEFFNRSVKELTPREMAYAERRGKALKEKAMPKEVSEIDDDEVVEEVDYEKLRRKVLRTIKNIRSKTVDFDPFEFPDMIPFKRWRRKVNALLKRWKEKEIRFAKLVNEIEQVTTEETFELVEKQHRQKFNGTALPKYKKVGLLVGDKLEVDDELVDAVPFLLDYLLHYEHRIMPQIMKFASGAIDKKELLSNPYEKDWTIDFHPHALQNTAENANLLSILCEVVGLTAPQDALYEHTLKVGDKISVLIDGEMCKRTVSDIEHGVCVGRGVGLLKLDKWYKL